MAVIAIHGKKRSGKGTIGQHLVEKYGFKHVVLSTPLKEMSSILLNKVIDFSKGNVSINDFIEGDKKETPLKGFNGYSPRDLMIWIGTQFSFSVNPDLWTDIALKKIETFDQEGKDVYVDNLRLYPEFNAMKKINAALWAVVSNNHYNSLPTQDRLFFEETGLSVNTLISDKKTIKEMVSVLNIDPSLIQHYETELTRVLSDGFNGEYDGQPVLSEKGLNLDEFDVIIQNDGSVDDLKNKIDTILYQDIKLNI